MITSCPHCSKRFTVDDSADGKQVRCTECERMFVVSAAEPSIPDDSPAPEPAPAAEPPRKKSKRPRLPRLGGSGLAALTAQGGPGKLLLLAGLVLVLFSRGGDAIGSRGVARAKAKLTAAQAEFNDKWQRQIDATDDPAERNKLRNDMTEQMQELNKGQWGDLRSAAEGAATSNVIWGYWREWLFVVGTMALAIGLVTVAFSTSGPERLVCLVMIGMLTFSIYIGGVAWLASAVSTISGGVQSVLP